MPRPSRTCAFGASSKATYYSLSACYLKTFWKPFAGRQSPFTWWFWHLPGSRNFIVFLLTLPLHTVASAVFAASPPFLLDVLCKVSSHFSTEVLSLSVKVPGAYLPHGCHGYLPGSLAAPLIWPGTFPTPIYCWWV